MDATVATPPAPAAQESEEGSSAATSVEERPNPFKGALEGAPAVEPAPDTGADPRSPAHDNGGTRVVPVTPAQSGVRQTPSAETLASEGARAAMQTPRLVSGEQQPVAAPAPAPQAQPAPVTQGSGGVGTALALMTIIAMIALTGGSWVIGKRDALERELQQATAYTESLRTTLREVRSVNSRLKSALATERSKPWWRRLNHWW